MSVGVEREVLVERATDRFDGMKISWGGVFGGVLAGIGTLLLLSSLGLAIGVSAVDPRDPNATAVGTGAAIWTALTLLISLFVGGWASTRLSMLWERTTAMFEGALVWVLSMIIVLYLTASGIGLLASSASGILGQTAQAVGASVGSMNEQDLSRGSVDEILARLRDPQTASAISTGLRVPREDVARTLGDISARVETARDNPARAADEVRSGMARLMSQAQENITQTAERAQPAASKTAWITFAALVLSLLAAIAGAAVGRRGVVGRVAE